MPLLMPLLMLAGAVHAQSRLAVFKCTDADGKLSYQQKPCPPRSDAAVLTVEGDIDPVLAQQARERAAANAPERRAAPEPATAPQLAQDIAPQRRPERCPPTRENPGAINVVGTDAWSMAIARSIYNDLPSETWLKNTGRWPKGCVR